MKNYEKYAEKIKEYKDKDFCKDFVKPHILKSRGCTNTSCDQCKMLQTIWLLEDYKEPEEPKVDWIVYAWKDAYTSWTAYNNSDVTEWEYAKLAESEDE